MTWSQIVDLYLSGQITRDHFFTLIKSLDNQKAGA
jgi:hypothetical protein